MRLALLLHAVTKSAIRNGKGLLPHRLRVRQASLASELKLQPVELEQSRIDVLCVSWQNLIGILSISQSGIMCWVCHSYLVHIPLFFSAWPLRHQPTTSTVIRSYVLPLPQILVLSSSRLFCVLLDAYSTSLVALSPQKSCDASLRVNRQPRMSTSKWTGKPYFVLEAFQKRNSHSQAIISHHG